MNVTILGSGNMARAVATRALAGGNNVQVLARGAERRQALLDELRSLATSSEAVAAGPLEEPLIGEIVVLAVPYGSVRELVRRYNEELNGKVLVDITNPVNDTYDALVTAPGTSAAEEIAKLLPPGASIVKAFNTIFAGTLVDGRVEGRPLDVFLAGDEPASKRTVGDFVEAGGLRALDAGPLSQARGLEGFELSHMLIQGQIGTQFKSAVAIVS